ncbi:MAG: transglutaminase domain-containing protein [Planctomycetota bacterium]
MEQGLRKMGPLAILALVGLIIVALFIVYKDMVAKKEDWSIKPDVADRLNDEAVIKLAPVEYQAKVKHALEVAGDNKKQLIIAVGSVPEKYRPALSFLISQTGYRYFFPSYDKKIADATTITAELVLTHTRLAYEARDAFPWAKILDDDTFRRFVLTYRTTTEKPVDWRSYFWKHPELLPLVDGYIKRFNEAKTDNDRDLVFKEMLHKINTEWVGKAVPYAPRGMPDMNPIEAINAKTGRCTDQTNTLIAVLRTFGIAATGVRSVWWPEQGDNHTWTAVYNPITREWMDIDSGQGGSAADPDYFRRFIRHPEKKAAKIYWVYPGEETGTTFTSLALKKDEAYPPSIEKYLIAKPMVDKTECYNDVIDLKQSNVPSDTLIWLAVFNDGAWKPVAGERSTAAGNVIFPKVGCHTRYRLMTWNNDAPAYCSEVLVPKPDGQVEVTRADARDDIPLLSQRAIKYLESGKYREAKETFGKLLELLPDNANALYNLACTCSLMGDKSEALDYLEKSIQAGWDDYAHIKKDTDLDNIRDEERFKKIMMLTDLVYPAERTRLGYAIIVSRATREDADWGKVVDAFAAKYDARIFTYEETDPAGVIKELINYAPQYVAFIAKQTEAMRKFVFRAKQMMRVLDADPYEDAPWGIITGYNYEDCLRMAKEDKLVIHKALSGVGSGWLDCFNEGLAFSEGEKNAMFVKQPGKPLERQVGPDDTTKSFVDALNTDEYQMMSTSGHATERDWQIGYSYPNGMLLSKGGKLSGRDLSGQTYPITTTNSKVYYSPGNCLIAHISNENCMALAWIHSGANQFFGHTLSQGQPCYAWNIVNYFMVLEGRFTYAESVYLHQVAADFTKAPSVCCHSTVFYGDPVWEARVASEREAPYTQSIKFDKAGNKVTITIAADFKQDYEDQPVAAFLPEPIQKQKTELISGVEAGLGVLALDNVVLINVGKRKKEDKVQVVITAELLPLKDTTQK